MFSEAYNRFTLTKVAIYQGLITPSEYEQSIECAWRMTEHAQRRPELKARLVVIVESDRQPPAHARKRLAEADAAMPNRDLAFVTSSAVARAAITAMGWLSPSNESRCRMAFSTFLQARDWLASRGADIEELQTLHARARGR